MLQRRLRGARRPICVDRYGVTDHLRRRFRARRSAPINVLRVKSVPMTIVQIRVMGMRMSHRFVDVPVRMGLGHGPVVKMLVMFVMDVAMFVLEAFVLMFVGMPLGEMKPKADRHQAARDQQLTRQGLAE
jgi:hypothetical protein